MTAPAHELVRLDADDAALVEQVVALTVAVRQADSPWVHPCTTSEVVGDVRYGWQLDPGHHVVAVGLDGTALAKGWLYTTTWDNPDLAWFDVIVHPSHRRRGLGTAMVRHLVDAAEAAGRTKLGIDSWDADGPRRFAEQLGFTLGSRSINRRQHLAELSLDELRLRHAEAEAHASSYELLRIEGRTPEELLPRWPRWRPRSTMHRSTTSTSRTKCSRRSGSATTRPRRWRVGSASTGWSPGTAESGGLAGHTVVAVEDERPAIGAQHDTSVVRAHRGHRLGLLLKAEMNLWLAEREPQLQTVDTWNAESNDHMIAVNELLAYRWMGRGLEYMSTVDRAREALGTATALEPA